VNPRVINGWLVVDTDAPDRADVQIALFTQQSKAFVPAFRDYEDGKRVAKIRVGGASGRAVVYLRVDGAETMAGNLTI
jgi:hypothetical protein